VGSLERGNVLLLDFAWDFDETARHPMKKLIGSQTPDIFGLLVHPS
jgi:hypothetical protein